MEPPPGAGDRAQVELGPLHPPAGHVVEPDAEHLLSTRHLGATEPLSQCQVDLVREDRGRNRHRVAPGQFLHDVYDIVA